MPHATEGATAATNRQALATRPSLVTNVLTHKTTGDRLDRLPEFAPSTYVAPETDAA